MITAGTTAAVEVFTALGWAWASLADVESLPLGTREQQAVARRGLASGEWGEIGHLGENSYGWIPWTDVDENLLAVFAVRVGVDARRAVRLLGQAHRVDDELTTRLVEARGARFAAQFVTEACRSGGRPWEHATSTHAGAVVRLVERGDLPVPEDLGYLKDWSVYALGALTGGGELVPSHRGWCEPDTIRRRLPEHVRAGVAVGVPATGPFGTVVPAAVDRGWLVRDEAVDLVLAALDAAQRPGDRKAWAQVLTGPLGLTDGELIARADALVAVLAHGEGPVVELLAPRLIAGAPDDVLGDVLAVTLLVPTKKVLRLLLTTAAERPRPSSDVVDTVAPLVAAYLASTDRALARAAATLTEAWGMDAALVEDAPAAAGLWLATPPVWDVPRFDAGTVSGAALTEAAALLTRRPEGVVDLDVERFLALANAVAAQDRAEARTALGGARGSWVGGLRCVPAWVTGERSPLLDIPPTDAPDAWNRDGTVWGPAEAREAAVLQRLGEVPVLLSTPTWVDLRIDPADLVDRLAAYTAAGAVVSEADLYLACTRLDPTLATEQVRAALDDLPVPVVLQDGAPAAVTAGPTVRRYLDAPFPEPALRLSRDGKRWEQASLTVPPEALSTFPARQGRRRSYELPGIEVFPAWGDALRGIGHSVDAASGLVLRQYARRGTPLTPGLAVNLLGAQRGFHPAAAVDGTTAIREAWERGLLRPGVADVRLLDWAANPSSLVALARACAELAADGLLSVVWPVLDDLLLASLRAPRMLAGTAEVAETMRSLLPAVLAAVASGDADPTVLGVPGLRALAGRPGSSNAVTAARAAAAGLPAVPADPAVTAPVRVEPAASPFDAVWAPGAGTLPAVDDHATLTARWVGRDATRKLLAVDLTLPDRPHEPYRVVKEWFYDLENEGQCAARSAAGHAWLHWDETAGRLVVSPHRDWRGQTDGPLRRGDAVPPLTTSMVAVVLASLSHADHHPQELLRSGLVGSAAVALAVRALVRHPDVSPARMVRPLESDATTLPVLWPVLVESVRHAATVDGAPPHWLNRVLDVALLHAAHLREAADRGLLPGDAPTWPGLAVLAARPGSSAALRKARDLSARLLTDPGRPSSAGPLPVPVTSLDQTGRP
ncbi:DUF6493 family protein [Cellulomonas cellasea]|uniref:DUF7824 domain-containing protein n=1 Tax=Cellulomonas cellasea TaxID=43670 RepID=A0A7W4YCU7_9CELL|nr:DUF6493 family protein [Cellulomonas cellasea]MBB2924037.1 hypothetical protein [Cellulomonas cellasea]